MEKPIYVIGHRNPDTDSIVSSITYAHLKRELGRNVIAGRIGPVNSETEYLLEKFGFEEPQSVFTARCTIKEIDIDDAYYVSKDITMKEALDVVLKRKNKGIIVVDKERHLEGLVAIDDLTSLWTVDEKHLISLMSKVRLDDVVKTLEAEIILDQKDFKTCGIIDFYPTINTRIEKDAIAIVTNNPEIQRHCIQEGVSLLVVVGENWVDTLTLSQAQARGIAIIYTPLSPLRVSQLIFQSPSVENIMVKSDKVITFANTATVEEASHIMAKSRFRSYPVLDEKKRVVGSISRYHILNHQKKRFILVDHNEIKQSVNDIESGEVIEIVDHHRLGGIETINPISITTMIVGATCTIIAMKYFEHGIIPSKEIAGLLLGGIIADTMNFKSPTTTQIDIDMADRLEVLAGVTKEEISDGLVAASESILNKRSIEIVYNDFKEFNIADSKIGLSQSPCKSEDEFFKIKETVLEYLEEVCTTQKYDLLMVMFTNPNGSGSHLLYTGKKAYIIEEAFKDIMIDEYVPNIVSRKKQVLPKIIELMEKN